MSEDIATRAEALATRIARLTPERVETPTLVYFDIIGICWPIRCLLHLQEVEYELIKVPSDLWAYSQPDGRRPLVASFPNGHVPLYVDAEIQLSQSNVIMTYLAEKHGLFGDDRIQALKIMEVMAHAYDALFHWSGMLQVIARMNLGDDIVQPRLQAFLGNGNWGLVSDGYRRNLDPFENYLAANPDREQGFIVGSRLSIADLHAFNVLCNWYKAFDRSRFVEQYPRLEQYLQRIAAIPGVADYIARRQEATTWLPLPRLGISLTTPEELIGLTPAR